MREIDVPERPPSEIAGDDLFAFGKRDILKLGIGDAQVFHDFLAFQFHRAERPEPFLFRAVAVTGVSVTHHIGVAKRMIASLEGEHTSRVHAFPSVVKFLGFVVRLPYG